MSRKTLRKAPAPPANQVVINLDDLFRDRVQMAVNNVSGWYGCPGTCFPLVFRAWMSHPAFQVA